MNFVLQADRDQLLAAINENASKGEDEINQLREVMLQERDERKYEVERMDNFLKKEMIKGLKVCMMSMKESAKE